MYNRYENIRHVFTNGGSKCKRGGEGGEEGRVKCAKICLLFNFEYIV